MTLDYRSPATPSHRAQQVMAALNNEVATNWLIAIVRFAIGVLLSLLPSALLIFIAPRRIITVFFNDPAIVYLGAAAVTVGYFYIAIRHRHGYIRDVLQGRMEEDTLMYEVLLFGPAMVLSAINEIYYEPGIDLRLQAMSAEIVVELLDARHSLPILALMLGNRSVEEVSAAIRFLEHRGWITVSRTRARVLLSSSVKHQFANLQ